MPDPSLIVSAISAFIASLSLFYSLKANRSSEKLYKTNELTQLRISVVELQAHIKSISQRFEDKKVDYPHTLFEGLDLSPEDTLNTLTEIEKELASDSIKKEKELSQLKVVLGKLKKEWELNEIELFEKSHS